MIGFPPWRPWVATCSRSRPPTLASSSPTRLRNGARWSGRPTSSPNDPRDLGEIFHKPRSAKMLAHGTNPTCRDACYLAAQHRLVDESAARMSDANSNSNVQCTDAMEQQLL